MTVLEQTQTDQITLTEAAASAVRDLMSRRNLQDHALRVFVSGGGCTGLQYGMAFEGRVREEDLVFEERGVKIVVDEESISYLKGAMVDYVDELMGSGFKISNPNAMTTCRCGQSFRAAQNAGQAGNCAC